MKIVNQNNQQRCLIPIFKYDYKSFWDKYIRQYIQQKVELEVC